MKLTKADRDYLRSCVVFYRARSESASDPYDVIIYSVCADVFQNILDELSSYHLPSIGAIVP